MVPVVSIHNMSKSFSGRTVLRRVSLDVLPGEVHGLLGQNASGKSTLIKILAGYHQPDPAHSAQDAPSLAVRGLPISLPVDPGSLARLGLAFVHQDLPAVLSGTVLENLRMGRFQTGLGGRILWRREHDRALRLLQQFGLTVHTDSLVSSLSEVERALLVILRALEGLPDDNAGLLVLDEPTAYLPHDGVERLFSAIRRVTTLGHGVLFVTHRLDEALSITDRLTILRDGELVRTVATSSVGQRDLVTDILGFRLEELYPEPTAASSDAQFALRVNDLSGSRLREFGFRARGGEIVGLTGLIGAGWEEIPYLLFGARRARGGEVGIGDRWYKQSQLTPRRAIEAGIALLPADRKNAGGVATATAAENVTMVSLSNYIERGFFRHKREAQHVTQLFGLFQVRPNSPGGLFSTFSGGNQQKALLAKWFQLDPKVLILHEPTQGVDIGAKQTIFKLIHDAAAAGACVLLASAEYEDLAHLCHRVIVFRSGRAAAELHGSALTQARILEQSLLHDVAVRQDKLNHRPTDGPMQRGPSE